MKQILLSIAMLLALASPAAAQFDLEAAAKNPPLFLETARKLLKWDEAAEPARLVGPIYFVGTKGLSVFLIKSSDGLIVLNTGMPGSGPMIAASIRKLGLRPEDIKLLLTGHAHIDHVGGHRPRRRHSRCWWSPRSRLVPCHFPKRKRSR